MPSKPKVAIVGGPDVDARLPLMAELADRYELCAFGSEARVAPRFAAAGFAFHHWPLSRRVAPFGDLRAMGHLRRALLRERPDIVHSFDTKPAVFGTLAARRAGVPVVVATITGLGSLYTDDGLATRVLRRIHGALQRVASRRADATVFQNHDDLEQLVAAGVVAAESAEVILGSGIDTRAYSPERVGDATRAQVRAELGIADDAVVVAMIARVTRSKGVLEFAAAARGVVAGHPRARFLLVGADDTDSRDRLSPAEVTELRRDVLWPGRRDDVARLLRAVDVFVLPTAYREGVPRVLLEAAAMELPLVATDSPGCNEVVVDGGNGRLVPAGSVSALTAAIAELVADPVRRLRYGAASRRRAVSMFDLRLVAARTHELYARLLVHGPRVQPTRASSRPVLNSESR